MKIKISETQLKILLSHSFFFSGLGIVLLYLHFLGIGLGDFSLQAIGFPQFFIGITALLYFFFALFCILPLINYIFTKAISSEGK